MSDLLPVDGRLPQTIEDLLPWRLALGQALQQAMSMKVAADETIAAFFGERTEAVVNGVTYQFDGSKSWEYEEVGLLAYLTELQATGELTQADFDAAVTLIPQPDRVKFNPTKLRQLVDKRGLHGINHYRVHKTATKRLRVIE